ncbi:MAG: hypothetical protein K9M49_04735, partial [Candidatus Marinimicrobia bacterium]|nr:hypothetical protein [Candidatus Neomarinimicrobiota bacterium]
KRTRSKPKGDIKNPDLNMGSYQRQRLVCIPHSPAHLLARHSDGLIQNDPYWLVKNPTLG